MVTQQRKSVVPDFQTVLLPLLRLAADGKEHSLSEALEKLAQTFSLDQSALSQLLPSGRQRTFDSRVGWAKTYLTKAGLIESTGRARFRITQRGLELLRTNPSTLNVSVLRRFPEFREFYQGTRGQRDEHAQEELSNEGAATPEELIESSYQALQRALAQDLLERVKQAPPRFF